jgi:hypothetical protein
MARNVLYVFQNPAIKILRLPIPGTIVGINQKRRSKQLSSGLCPNQSHNSDGYNRAALNFGKNIKFLSFPQGLFVLNAAG